jgi:deoxycytidine triphosphate deaminase
VHPGGRTVVEDEQDDEEELDEEIEEESEEHEIEALVPMLTTYREVTIPAPMIATVTRTSTMRRLEFNLQQP